VKIYASDLAEAISAMERAEDHIRDLGISRSTTDIQLQVDLEYAARRLRNSLRTVDVEVEDGK
jgi:hypothetical protein